MKEDEDAGCRSQCMVLAVVVVLGLEVIMILMLSGTIPTGKSTVHCDGQPKVVYPRPIIKLVTSNLTQNVATAHVPIPIMDADQGVRYNSSSAGSQIRMDVMLETNCPDSVDAWPELKQAADFYGPGVMDLVVYHFQLPYHRWAHLCTQGWFTIKDQQGPAAAISYMEHLFSVSSTYSSGSTEDRTYNQMLDQLANDANIATGIDPNSFKAVIDNYGGVTVQNWKHDCRRGAAGTPWYYLNGVDLGINYVMNYTELRGLIDPLLA